MANANGSIDEIIGEAGIKQISVTTDNLKAMWSIMQDCIKAARELNINIAQTKGLADQTKALSQASKAIEDMNAATLKALTINEKLAQQQEKTAAERLKTAQQQERLDKEKITTQTKQLDLDKKIEAQSKANAKAAENQASAYIRLRNAHKEAEKVALEAGVTYGKNSEQFKAAAKTANDLRTQFVDLHKELGNNRDNVGNYAGAFSKVWAGLRQVAYIIPGLGIAGIFNLIGEAAVNLYDKITDVTEATKKQAETQKLLKETMENSLQSGGREIVNLESLYKRATNVNAAMDTRLKAVRDLQDQYPHYFGNLDKEIILAGKAKDVYLDLNKQLVNSVIYRGFQSIADEMSKDLPKLLLIEDILSKKVSEIYGKKSQPDDYSNAGRLKAQEERKQLLESIKSIPGIGEELSKTMEKEGLTVQQMLSKTTNLIDEQQNKIKNILQVADQYSSTLIGGKDKKEAKVKDIAEKKPLMELIRPFGLPDLTEMDEVIAYYKKQLELLKDIFKEWTENPENNAAMQKNWFDNFVSPILNDADAQKLNEQLSEWAIKRREGLEGEAKDKKKRNELEKEYKSLLQDINQITNSISDLSGALIDRELNQLEKKDKLISEQYKNELRFIEQSGLSTKQKEKQRQELEAETEAKRKKNDRERVDALRKEAKLKKAITISEIIAQTALAITTDLKNPIKIAFDIAIGAAQLAKVIATPLPQYAKGRKGGKAEWAIVGEEGTEGIRTPDGKMTLTPNKPTVTFLPKDAEVIPHHEMIKNAAFVHLAKQSQVTVDKYQQALIDKFEEELEELRGIKSAILNKEFGNSMNVYKGFEQYKNTNIR